MIFISIIFSVIFLILNAFTLPVLASDYCIFLKDGRKILAVDHWYENDKLNAVINGGATIIIDKNKIVKIVDTENFIINSSREKDLENKLSKYETNGAIFILTDGKKLSVRKSWIDNSEVCCLVNNDFLTLSLNDIKDVHIPEINKELKIPTKRKKNKSFEKDPITVSIKKKIEKTQEFCKDLHFKLKTMDERYSSIKIRNNKKANYEQFKKYQASNNELKDEHMEYLFKLQGCRKELERLDNDFNTWRSRYFDEIDRKNKENKWKAGFKKKFE